MEKEIIDLGHGKIEVVKDGHLIYLNVVGEYTDDDAIRMTEYLERFFTEKGGKTVRVWDSRNISETGFKLTSEGTDRFAEWSREAKKKWPDNVAYMIGDSPLIFGVSRMYEIKASDNDASIRVVHNLNELPENVKSRIFSFL